MTVDAIILYESSEASTGISIIGLEDDGREDNAARFSSGTLDNNSMFSFCYLVVC